MLKFTQQWIILLAGLLLLAGMVFFRLTAYGPWGDSISTNDTPSYLDTAHLPADSYTFFTAIRSASYPLLFNWLAPIDEYQITKISEPYFHAEGDLAFQPGFDRVVNLQMWVAVFSWAFLAVVFFARLRNPWARLAALLIILVFGFSPQMADWDSLIMTESLSFSLFFLMLGLLVELAFCFITEVRWRKTRIWLILMTLAVITPFWILLRDTNVYFIPFTLVFVAILAALAWRRWKETLAPLVVFTVLMVAAYIFQQATFRDSERWVVPFYNNVTRAIFPYPSRVEFFLRYGMPVNDTILSYQFSQQLEALDPQSDFVIWTHQSALQAYMDFVISHPFSFIKMAWDDTPSLWTTNVQPYFFQADSGRPAWLIPYADYLHPTHPLPLAVDGVLVLLVLGFALKQRRQDTLIWAWVALWLYGISLLFYFTGYIGEMRSVLRHVMSGVVPLRLGLWLLLAVVADLLWSRPAAGKKQT